jgi:hypothetical protein
MKPNSECAKAKIVVHPEYNKPILINNKYWFIIYKGALRIINER